MSKLTDILQSIRPESDFTQSSDFLEDGLLDSFDMVTLVSSLDQAYGISIDGLDIVPDNFKSIAAITALLGKYGATE
ncbi:acyl carrier protein [Herbaspirillum sp. RU 5E]|jgi:acyl carrier protein|uniref:acyl carrier protein n=1 Tax=Herbaspirillum sp. CAH-3 TaxID=2605746 RepID=UPI0012AC697B|nr:acyl carrier protein [Herbaspirillum sp. CAH-3]MBW9332827.1 acyl carrier protein [Herbaspirillum sp. RU 5E]MRT30639.1 acyl carrier protein [Herbaspirillum sp. CAH-3]